MCHGGYFGHSRAAVELMYKRKLLALVAMTVIAAALHADQTEPEIKIMAEPLHRTVMTAFVLPELQPELGLSAQQVTQLRQMKQAMLVKGGDFFNRLAARHAEVDRMLTPGTSKGELVKKTLEQIATLRADRLYVVYQTEARMLIPLSQDQRKKLASLKPQEMHQAIVSRLSQDDLAKMRELLDGERTLMH